MRIIFSSHAMERAKERFISKRVIEEAILKPDKVEKSSRVSSRYLIKKIYFNQKLNNFELRNTQNLLLEHSREGKF